MIRQGTMTSSSLCWTIDRCQFRDSILRRARFWVAKKRDAVNQWCLHGSASAEDAQKFLVANYRDRECRRIAESLVCPDRKRSITICMECEHHVQEDFTGAVPGSALRLCDHVVDPVYTSACTQGPETAHKRFQGALWPSSASHEHDSPVLGLSIDEFATPVAALTDHEEMVFALVHPLV